MSIDKIQHQFFRQHSRNHILHLREGQIVEGKIEQLYTDDKARVKIGSSTLIAQIEMALSVGESYYFQVNEKNDQVYLQVVQGDGQNRTANFDNLLSQLQVKPSKVNRQFVEQLISSGIPFNRNEIEQALSILNRRGNKSIASEVLQDMFQSKLPITENVYQAIATFNTTDFSTLLQSIYNSLQENRSELTNEETVLMKLIQSFIERPQTIDKAFVQSLLLQGKQDNAFVSMLQMTGVFDISLSHEQVVAQLENYTQNTTKQPFPLQQMYTKAELQHLIRQSQTDITALLKQQQAITRTALTAISLYHPVQTEALNEQAFASLKQMIVQDLLPLLPSQMSQQVEALLEQITINDQKELTILLRTLSNQNLYTQLTNHVETVNNVIEETKQNPLLQQSAIKQSATQLLQQYPMIQETTMNERQITTLVKAITTELIPLLPKQVVDQMTSILDKATSETTSSIMNMLQSLASSDINIANPEVLSSPLEFNKGQQTSIQQQLLTQITQYMQSIGLTMEYDMMQAVQTKDIEGLQAAAQTETIKSLLLQLVQHGGQQTEQMQQLVHFINGLQLQTLTETNQMLQAQLYIPGNPFALNDDIFMKFESKKSDNEQIDADYCRIIFMLDLEQIQETIVDMQVQKRVITVTIFNDIVSEVVGMNAIRQEMKSNLQNIDYQLSTVEWKPLSKQTNDAIKKQSNQNLYYNQEGFDLKI